MRGWAGYSARRQKAIGNRTTTAQGFDDATTTRRQHDKNILAHRCAPGNNSRPFGQSACSAQARFVWPPFVCDGRTKDVCDESIARAPKSQTTPRQLARRVASNKQAVSFVQHPPDSRSTDRRILRNWGQRAPTERSQFGNFTAQIEQDSGFSRKRPILLKIFFFTFFALVLPIGRNAENTNNNSRIAGSVYTYPFYGFRSYRMPLILLTFSIQIAAGAFRDP